jgi:hypothetical protein
MTPALLLDHAILLVRDLLAAEQLLRDAGFTLGRAGAHPGLGTHNRLLLLERGPYLELLAVQTARAENAGYQALLAQRPAVLGLALASGDVAATAARMAAAGVSAGRPFQASRPLPATDAQPERLARFSLLPLPEAPVAGGFAFHCQHHTPQWVWEEAPAHTNRTQALIALSGAWAAPPEPWSDMTAPAGTRASWVALRPAAPAPSERVPAQALHFDTGARLVCGAGGLSWVPA